MKSLLARPEFRRLWAGQTISEIGSRVSREGIPLTAALLLGASPAEMGVLAATTGVTALVASTAAGVLVDRRRRRPLMIFADLARAAVLLLVPIAAWTGWLSFSLLLAVVAVHGLFTVLFDVAYQTWLPTFVEPDQLLDANAKLTAAASTAEIVGPGLTGVLVQWLTAPIAIFVDSLSFVVSALALAGIDRSEDAPPVADTNGGWREALLGFAVLRRDPVLRALALRALSVTFFFGFFSALYVLYAVTTLALAPALLGIIVAAGGVSSLAGALVANRLAGAVKVGHLLVGATAWSGIVLFLLPLARLDFPGPFACLFLAQLFGDVSFSVYAIHETTIRQKLAPPELLGRVNAAVQLLAKGSWPIGALVGGVLASHIDIAVVLGVCALGVTLSAVWLWASPVRTLE